MSPADAWALGAVAGLLSSALMTLFEAPFWASLGAGGVVEWEVNQILVSRLLGVKHDIRLRLKEAVGMHLFHGTVAGAVLAAAFSSLVYAWKPFFWLAALLFSLLLWTVAPFLLRRSLERMGSTHF